MTTQISEKSGVNREYLLAFGPVEEYLKVIKEERPNRWKNLARRAFLQRPILKYAEAFAEHAASGLDDAGKQMVAELDAIVEELNGIHDEVVAQDSELPYERLTELYERARALLLVGPEGSGPTTRVVSLRRAVSPSGS